MFSEVPEVLDVEGRERQATGQAACGERRGLHGPWMIKRGLRDASRRHERERRPAPRRYRRRRPERDHRQTGSGARPCAVPARRSTRRRHPEAPPYGQLCSSSLSPPVPDSSAITFRTAVERRSSQARRDRRRSGQHPPAPGHQPGVGQYPLPHPSQGGCGTATRAGTPPRPPPGQPPSRSGSPATAAMAAASERSSPSPCRLPGTPENLPVIISDREPG